MTMSTQRPPKPARPVEACLLCPPILRDGEWQWRAARKPDRTCANCADRLGEQLREIRRLAPQITPERGQSEPGRPVPGYHSVSPAFDLAIAVMDRRNSAVIRAGDVYDLRGELHSWANWVRKDRPLPPAVPPVTIDSEISLLLAHLPWITAHDWVDGFAVVVGELVSLARVVTHNAAVRVPIGHCPDCDAPLYATLGAEVIYCGCGARWPKGRWSELGRTLETRATLAAALRRMEPSSVSRCG